MCRILGMCYHRSNRYTFVILSLLTLALNLLGDKYIKASYVLMYVSVLFYFGLFHIFLCIRVL